MFLIQISVIALHGFVLEGLCSKDRSFLKSPPIGIFFLILL